MFELTGPLLNRWLAPFYTGVDISTSIRLSVLIATLMALASCPGRDEDCPTVATEETKVTQSQVRGIDFPLDHPRKIKPAEFPSAERNRLLGKLPQEFEPLGNITVSARTRDGLFIGIDDGEWGGKLLYVPNETKFPNQQIISENVTFAFEKGDRLFILTGALLDRLTHHVHILEMNGDSFRLASSRKRQKEKESSKMT